MNYETNKNAEQPIPSISMYGYNPGGNGLDIFRNITSLLIKQRGSIAEVILGFPSKAKYDILNEKGDQVLFAYEESTCCQRLILPTSRKFTLHILNNIREEIIRVHREFSCCAGCCWLAYCDACRQEVTIEAPPGNLIGTIIQDGSCWRMRYLLCDDSGSTNLIAIGPYLMCDGPCTCCFKNKFTILGTDEFTEIGFIRKLFAGYLKETFTTADHFKYEVPHDLDIKMKAIILGAVFVINVTNFGRMPQKRQG